MTAKNNLDMRSEKINVRWKNEAKSCWGLVGNRWTWVVVLFVCFVYLPCPQPFDCSFGLRREPELEGVAPWYSACLTCTTALGLVPDVGEKRGKK